MGNIIDSIKNVYTLASKTKLIIWAVYTVLCFFFAWLNYKGLPIAKYAKDEYAALIFRTALFIYTFSWLAGTLFDVNVKSACLADVPYQGNIRPLGILIVLFIFGGFLLLLKSNYHQIFMSLLVFIIINNLGWIYMNKYYMKPAISNSNKMASQLGNTIIQIKLALLAEYDYGKWQIKRFMAAYAYIIIVNILVLTGVIDNLIKPLHYFESSKSLIAFFMLVFTLFVESWIWVYRIKIKSVYSFLDQPESLNLLKQLK